MKNMNKKKKIIFWVVGAIVVLVLVIISSAIYYMYTKTWVEPTDMLVEDVVVITDKEVYSKEDKILEEYPPKENIKDIIEISLEYAKNENIKLSEYYIIAVKYEGYDKDYKKKIWDVHFMNRFRPEGDMFWLHIDDDTGKIINILYGE